MVKELLKAFYRTCNKKPERILFYRDGISEGLFKTVVEGEVKAIKGILIFYMNVNFVYTPIN